MPIWVRPSANQARQREGMENLLRSEPHERQNRPEGAQASAQSQEREKTTHKPHWSRRECWNREER